MTSYNQINTLTDILCLDAGIIHYTAIVSEDERFSLDAILSSLSPEESRKVRRNFRKQIRKSVKDKSLRDRMDPGQRRRSVMTRIRNKAWNTVIAAEREIEDNLP